VGLTCGDLRLSWDVELARRPGAIDPAGIPDRGRGRGPWALCSAGEATPAQIGAFLTLLHAKGETIEEVTGLWRAMLDAAVPLR
jgi:hypothetical protein